MMMVHDISLDHLKEEEVEAILKVLERDAHIQKNEETRRQRLRDSIRFERIPSKRLSVKLRTGEWMNEITEPSRQKETRGTDIIRASIKRKKSKKDDQFTATDDNQAENAQLHKSKPDVVIDADKLDAQPIKSPTRKPTIRRKQAKQVTFNDNKTEKIVYNVTTNSTPDKSIVTEPVKQGNDSDYSANQVHEDPIQVAVVPTEASASEKLDERVDDIFTSFATVEHHDRLMPVGAAKLDVVMSVEHQEEKLEDEKPAKKVRYIKRKGSSRRKVLTKLSDDLDRDNLFREPQQNETKDLVGADNITPEVEVAAAAVVEATKNEPKETPNEYRKELGTVDTLNSVPQLTVGHISDKTTGEMSDVLGELEGIQKTAFEPDNMDMKYAEEKAEVDDSAKHEEPSDSPADVKTESSEPQGGDHGTTQGQAEPDNMKYEKTTFELDNMDMKYAKEKEDVDNSTKHEELSDPPADVKTESSEPLGDNHDATKGQAERNLEIHPNYADVTLKPNEISKILYPNDDAGTVDQGDEAGDDGWRTPTFEMADDFMTGIEAALPQLNLIPDTSKSQSPDMDLPGASVMEHTKKEDADKPKKKIVKKIIKKKHDAHNEKDASSHDSQRNLDDEARSLIDEVAKSMVAPDQDKENEDHSTELGRKKIVKRIIKKKKVDDSAADESPQPNENAPTEDSVDNPEFRVSRRKTVRKKVVKRQPPPPPQE